MKRVLVGIARFFMNLLYAICDVLPRRDEVLFFSRQANEPSTDFTMLGGEFQRRGFSVTYLTKKLSADTVVPYAFFAMREVYHLARCRICFLDRYDPVICLLRLKCEPPKGTASARAEAGGALHKRFPTEPLVIQLWHAYGAFKKFGYQSLGTIEGHTRANALLFRIHNNYSYVLCTGEGNRAAFAEAFSYPAERIVALGRPQLDLYAGFDSEGEGGKPVVLFAPTLRKSKRSPHPMARLHESGAWKPLERDAEVVWSFHPLESRGVAPGSVNEHLAGADIVVTDYSSIVYEAYLLGKKVLFYVPDIEEYRVSPGLNTDPLEACPQIACLDVQALLDKVASLLRGEAYPRQQLDAFVGDTFAVGTDGATKAIADFACAHALNVTCI